MNTLREHIGISHEPNRNDEKNEVKILEAKDAVAEVKQLESRLDTAEGTIREREGRETEMIRLKHSEKED